MKRGDVVRVVDENDCRDFGGIGSAGWIGKHNLPVGHEVTLLRHDLGDDSWLCKTDDLHSTWIYSECLTEAVEVTPREVAEAIASIKRAAINT